MSSGSNFTFEQPIKIPANELSVTVYAELIVVTQVEVPAPPVPSSACGECRPTTSFRLERDLFDPLLFQDVRALAYSKGLNPAGYTFYSRNCLTNLLRVVPPTTAITNRLSIVAVALDVTGALLGAAMRQVANGPGLLPARVC